MFSLDKIIGGMFTLIALYLVLRYSSNAATVISSGGGFITNQTAALQGNYRGGVIPGNRAAAFTPYDTGAYAGFTPPFI